MEVNSLKPCTVYALTDETTGTIRYIGQTTLPLKLRLKHHLTCSRAKKRRHVSQWILSVVNNGGTISIITLCENAVWNTTEREFISEARAKGVDLVNLTDGGDGSQGKVWTIEQREAVSKKMKGRKKTDEHRKKISDFMKTRPVNPESRRKNSQAKKGKRPQNLTMLHESKRGVPRSEETKKKISESLKGRMPDRTPEQWAAFHRSAQEANKKRRRNNVGT